MSDVNPSGLGVCTDLAGLPGSFASAVTALRLCDPPEVTSVHADEQCGLIEVLGQSGTHRSADDHALDEAMAPPWARATLDALLRASTAREAVRLVGVHQSTMQAWVETLTADLGYDPTQGYGRARAAVAFLGWRLSSSRVLDLPTPGGAVPNRDLTRGFHGWVDRGSCRGLEGAPDLGGWVLRWTCPTRQKEHLPGDEA